MGGDYRGADAGAGNGLAPVDHLPVRLAPPQHLHTTITSHDVAALVTTLCGAAFSRTTGAQVPIDGGNERVI